MTDGISVEKGVMRVTVLCKKACSIMPAVGGLPLQSTQSYSATWKTKSHWTQEVRTKAPFRNYLSSIQAE